MPTCIYSFLKSWTAFEAIINVRMQAAQAVNKSLAFVLCHHKFWSFLRPPPWTSLNALFAAAGRPRYGFTARAGVTYGADRARPGHYLWGDWKCWANSRPTNRKACHRIGYDETEKKQCALRCWSYGSKLPDSKSGYWTELLSKNPLLTKSRAP